MNRIYLALFVGIIFGALSWAVVPILSNKFEPFDSESGFYLGQSVLSIIAIYLGYKYGLKYVLMFVLGIYISSNVYPYIFGSSESSAWALLGLITTLALCVFPFIFGVVGKVLKIGHIKYIKSLKNVTSQSDAP
ncbi:MAG: hypothetical protein OEY52_00245 [Gammaproteobacteria bacterium]|nr:hypothetical protein [Gammaproteobacteria bacterium]